MNKVERFNVDLKKPTSRGGRLRRRIVTGLVILVIAGAVAAVVMRPATQHAPQGGGRFQRQADQPVPTLAAAARTADVPVYLDGVGIVKALNTVTVSSQVDGKLVNIFFKEGQDVEQGFVLAQIDPTIYQAQYDQAVAKKAQDEATLANARVDLVRYINLAKTNAGPQQQADTQKALVAQLEAQVKSDQAAIDNQRAYLAWTKVVAPISGRTGIRQVDVGNIVQGSNGTPIVVLTQLRPISIIFTLPQQQLAQVTKALAAGEVKVDAFGQDHKSIIDNGSLKVVDNQIDQATGTLKLKAEFANKDLQLWPGQFVDVRILVDTLHQVIVVPTAAVQRGPNGPFVFVVGDDSKVAMRPVTVTQQDEDQSVITSGVASGDRVITTGFNQLADGSRVTIGSDTPSGATPASPDAPAGTPARPRRQPGNAGAQSDQQGSGQRRGEREATSQKP
jgi:membrane fusion protein, multidrug efflux system